MYKLFSIIVFACMASFAVQARTLAVYYSYTNNVKELIGELCSQIECDVVEIEPAEKGLNYEANGYALGSALISAIRNHPDDADSYPAIDPVDVDLSKYDTIIIGAPLWWSQMAAPLQTFLFNHGAEMAGKHIGVIVSSHSSGISGVVADAKRLIPDGKFFEPSLWIRSAETTNCSSKISQWLKDINYEDISTSIAEGGELPLSASIFNISGIKVAETKDFPLDLSALSPGIYILSVITPSGRKSYKITL